MKFIARSRLNSMQNLQNFGCILTVADKVDFDICMRAGRPGVRQSWIYDSNRQRATGEALQDSRLSLIVQFAGRRTS
jgi:hypothetical protein